MSPSLEAVEHAAKKVDEWNERLEDAIQKAADNGESLRAIAAAARISHETVRYQLRQARQHSRPTEPSG